MFYFKTNGWNSFRRPNCLKNIFQIFFCIFINLFKNKLSGNLNKKNAQVKAKHILLKIEKYIQNLLLTINSIPHYQSHLIDIIKHMNQETNYDKKADE